MSSADVIGSLDALTRTTVTVKVTHRISTASGVAHFPILSATNVAALAASRGEVRVEGDVVASFVCPASADFVAAASAAIVPCDAGLWPSDVEQVAEAPGASNFATSAISGTSVVSLSFDSAINRVLKPTPIAGRSPAIVVGWDVDTTKTEFTARFEFTLHLHLTGVDWVRPSSWAARPQT